MSCDTDKRKLIEQLKKEASELKELMNHKEGRRRPIIIEFSGCPKSGKTSSINSLLQFLKRNEIKATVIQESASISPVMDKHSPLFNLWTVCNTICSLVGLIESKKANYDVIIMDRGIFDALCWFKWLFEQKKMDLDMWTNMNQFIKMPEIIAYIDIVILFKATPEVSIEREYASLLTDISGSIMNREVLGQYSNAVDKTKLENSQCFRKIIEINTSEKTQDDVGKEITEETLKALRALLEENVGYFEKEGLNLSPLEDNHICTWDAFCKSNHEELKLAFSLRTELEKDYSKVQPIPIACLVDEASGKLLCVKKNPHVLSPNSPERDKLLLYVGGHIRDEDLRCGKENRMLDVCKNALKREINEEIGISVALDDMLPYVIYFDDKTKSSIHMAICFKINISSESIKLRMLSSELIQNKGTTKSGKFVRASDMQNEILDTWSKTILKIFLGLENNAQSMNQISMFK